jgi:hypothetical protein
MAGVGQQKGETELDEILRNATKTLKGVQYKMLPKPVVHNL